MKQREEQVRKMNEQFIEWSAAVDGTDLVVQSVIAELAGGGGRVLDVGGGAGQVARAIGNACQHTQVDIVDLSAEAGVNQQTADRVAFFQADILDYQTPHRYDVAIARVVLHHLVGETSGETEQKTTAALEKVASLLKPDGRLVVLENIYEGLAGSDIPGWLIFALTKSPRLAAVMQRLGANTAGIGVRFRSRSGWERLFDSAGFDCSVVDRLEWIGWSWKLSPLLCRDRYQIVWELKPHGGASSPCAR